MHTVVQKSQWRKFGYSAKNCAKTMVVMNRAFVLPHKIYELFPLHSHHACAFCHTSALHATNMLPETVLPQQSSLQLKQCIIQLILAMKAWISSKLRKVRNKPLAYMHASLVTRRTLWQCQKYNTGTTVGLWGTQNHHFFVHRTPILYNFLAYPTSFRCPPLCLSTTLLSRM